MALTPSNMLPLDTIAPAFNLLDTVSDKKLSLNEISGDKKGTVVIFMCNHCPFVKHILVKLIEVAHTYQNKGVVFLGINANDIKTYPEDSPDHMKALAKKMDFRFPYLYDETQAVAKAYNAACTPDIYLFNEHLKLVYRGCFDESRPGNNIPVTGKNLSEALDQLLAHEKISDIQHPSVGCNIKWK